MAGAHVVWLFDRRRSVGVLYAFRSGIASIIMVKTFAIVRKISMACAGSQNVAKKVPW